MNIFKVVVLLTAINIFNLTLTTINLTYEPKYNSALSCDEILIDIEIAEDIIRSINMVNPPRASLTKYAHQAKLQREKSLEHYEQKCLPYLPFFKQMLFKIKHKHSL